MSQQSPNQPAEHWAKAVIASAQSRPPPPRPPAMPLPPNVPKPPGIPAAANHSLAQVSLRSALSFGFTCDMK